MPYVVPDLVALSQQPVIRVSAVLPVKLGVLLLQLLVLELVALDGVEQGAEHADVLAEVLLGVEDITAESEITQLLVHAGRSFKH